MALAGQGGHCVCEAKGRESESERDGFKVGHVCGSEKERRTQEPGWPMGAGATDCRVEPNVLWLKYKL